VALPNVERINIEILDQWFSVLIDTLNYDLGQIQTEVPTLVDLLTYIDTAPIAYLKDSLNDLVNNINKAFSDIDERLRMIESKIGRD
jgi:hypothetical protein